MKSKAITLIGLTGQTGAGKSTVSAYLRSWGCRVVDADSAARRAVQRGSECLLRIAGAFGEGILLPDGSLDRARLGRLVFSDKEKKKTLEGIIFPYIMAVVDKDIESGREEGEAAVFLDAPTLFESGADSRCGFVISVIASAELRLKRIMIRDGLTREDALLRMGAQHDDDFYVSRSRYILRNEGSEYALAAQTRAILDEIGLLGEAGP